MTLLLMLGTMFICIACSVLGNQKAEKTLVENTFGPGIKEEGLYKKQILILHSNGSKYKSIYGIDELEKESQELFASGISEETEFSENYNDESEDSNPSGDYTYSEIEPVTGETHFSGDDTTTDIEEETFESSNELAFDSPEEATSESQDKSPAQSLEDTSNDSPDENQNDTSSEISVETSSDEFSTGAESSSPQSSGSEEESSDTEQSSTPEESNVFGNLVPWQIAVVSIAGVIVVVVIVAAIFFFCCKKPKDEEMLELNKTINV